MQWNDRTALFNRFSFQWKDSKVWEVVCPAGSLRAQKQSDRRNAYIHRILVEKLGQGFTVGGPHTAGAEVAWHLCQRPLQLNRQHHQTWSFLHIACHGLTQLANPHVHQ